MPTLAILDDAMRRAGRAVPAINRLGGGTIATTADGQPWRTIGTTAVVYQLRLPNRRLMAIRCPLTDTPDPALAERYRALAFDPAIKQLAASPAGAIARDVAYLPEGLLLPAPDFRSVARPIVAMEWIDGPTLLEAADRACQTGDADTLDGLADAWSVLFSALAAARFLHGDLTADNALVRPNGTIAVVDYDTASWPGSPRVTPARGAAGYSHPSGAVAGDRADDFAALVVYVSLRVLAQWPDLRAEHGDPANRAGGSLLFAPRDLTDPDGSRLFRALRDLDEPETRGLVGALRHACLSSVEAVPPLREVVAAVRAASRGAAARPVSPSSPPPVNRQPNPPRAGAATPPAPPGALGRSRERQQRLTRLNSLLLAGDEDGAYQFWHESGLSGDPDAIRDLGPRMAEIERRRALRRAPSPRLPDLPPARDHTPFTEPRPARDSAPFADPRPTRERPPASDPWAAREQGDVIEPRSAPQQRTSPVPRPASTQLPWVERPLDRLRTALDAGDAVAVARLWPEAREDPLAAPLAIRVNEAVAGLVGAAIAGAIERGDDAAIIAAVHDAEEAGVAVSLSARRAAREARGRAATRRELEAALAANDHAELSALAISGRLDELGSLDPAIVRTVWRALAWPQLARALDFDDDAAIVNAYDEKLFSETGALTPEHRARVELARARLAWQATVRNALRQRDAVTLRKAMRAAPPGAAERLTRVERTRIDRLSDRGDAVDELARSLREGPDTAIVEAISRVEAAGASLPDALDWAAVRDVVDRVSLADAIRRAATADPPDYARLARLLPVARAAATSGDSSLGLDFAALETDVLRAAQLARLRDALFHDDDAAIAAAAHPDPYDVLSSLNPEQRARAERALAARRGGRPLASSNPSSQT